MGSAYSHRVTGPQKTCGDRDFVVKMVFSGSQRISCFPVCYIVGLQQLSNGTAGAWVLVVPDIGVHSRNHPFPPLLPLMLTARWNGRQDKSILEELSTAGCIEEGKRWSWGIREQILEDGYGLDGVDKIV